MTPRDRLRNALQFDILDTIQWVGIVLAMAFMAATVAYCGWILYTWGDWETGMRSKDRTQYNACYTKCYPNVVDSYHNSCICDMTKVVK